MSEDGVSFLRVGFLRFAMFILWGKAPRRVTVTIGGRGNIGNKYADNEGNYNRLCLHVNSKESRKLTDRRDSRGAKCACAKACKTAATH